MKKKLLTTTFIGAAGLLTGLAHAGIPTSNPQGDVDVACGGSDGGISFSWKNDSCTFEAEVRCDGADSEDGYGYGAVCIDWLADGDSDWISGAFQAYWAHEDTGCSPSTGDFIGGDLSEYGTGAWSPAVKIETKVTSEAKGNGKQGHKGQKGESGITVEFEVKRVDCD